MIAYPTKRVIILFTLCPALPGPVFFVFAIASEIITKNTLDNAGYVIGTALYFCFVSSIFGVILFGIPAFFLSLIYVSFQLTKCFKHILLIVLLGGFVAMGWCLATPFEALSTLAFWLGSVTSLGMAFYALPKPEHTG